MDDNKKPPEGAPSSDTTSALFVTARKKQLEQQEAERQARAKEEERLAAEAEVRRLEQEVEERRRRAEEEARRVEQEAYRIAEETRVRKAHADAEAYRIAEETRVRQAHADAEAYRIAEEAQIRNELAAQYPNAVLGVPQQRPQKLPKPAKGPGQGGLFANKKLLAIIGGGALALIVLVVVLVVAFGGGSSDDDYYNPYDPYYSDEPDTPVYNGMYTYHDDYNNIWFEYPADYTIFDFYESSAAYTPIIISNDGNPSNRMYIYNYTPEFKAFVEEGYSGMDNLVAEFAMHYMGDMGYDDDDMSILDFSKKIVSDYGYEYIYLFMENDEYYFLFSLIKVMSERQQMIATVIRAQSAMGVEEFYPILESVNLMEGGSVG